MFHLCLISSQFTLEKILALSSHSLPLSNWRQQQDLPVAFSSVCTNLGLSLSWYVLCPSPMTIQVGPQLDSCQYFNIHLVLGKSKLGIEVRVWSHRFQRQAPHPQGRCCLFLQLGLFCAGLAIVKSFVFWCITKRSISRMWVQSCNV